MKPKQVVDQLVSLVLLDIDAIHAYDQAIKNIKSLSVKNQFYQFKYDHERHFQSLSEYVQRLGSESPQLTPEFKGYSFAKFRSLEGKEDLEEILNLMLENEKCTNMTYDEVLSYELPHDVRIIVMNNRDDERRHLKYMKYCIDSKIWMIKAA